MYQKILAAAVKLALAKGLSALTRSAVAKAAKVAPGSVSYQFDDMAGLVDAVVKEAIKQTLHPIVAQAIAANHPAVKDLPPADRNAALSSLA